MIEVGDIVRIVPGYERTVMPGYVGETTHVGAGRDSRPTLGRDHDAHQGAARRLRAAAGLQDSAIYTFEAKVEKVETRSAGEESGACVIRASA